MLIVLITWMSFHMYGDRYLINHYNSRFNAGFIRGPADDVCLWGVGQN